MIEGIFYHQLDSMRPKVLGARHPSGAIVVPPDEGALLRPSNGAKNIEIDVGNVGKDLSIIFRARGRSIPNDGAAMPSSCPLPFVQENPAINREVACLLLGRPVAGVEYSCPDHAMVLTTCTEEVKVDGHRTLRFERRI
jgi:hypothetical protein